MALAFPVTPILDNFNRSDEYPLSSPWKAIRGIPIYEIVSNVAELSYTMFGGDYWSRRKFRNCEAYMTITNIGFNSLASEGVFLRMQNPGRGTVIGYMVEWTKTNEIILYRALGGEDSFDQISYLSRTFSNGYKLGARMINNVVSIYTDEGSGWAYRGVLIDPDNTYPEAGYLGTWAFDTSINVAQIDDFGGGGLPDLPYTEYVEDDFQKYVHGVELGSMPYWSAVENSMLVQVISGLATVEPNTVFDETPMIYHKFKPELNQWAEAHIIAFSSPRFAGAMVRCEPNGSSSDYYAYYADGADFELGRVKSGSWNMLASYTDDEARPNETLRLEAVGTDPVQLRCYRNNMPDTNIGVNGIYRDSHADRLVSAGYTGLAGYGDGATRVLTFRGGNVGT